jgi:hypothetical protein
MQSKIQTILCVHNGMHDFVGLGALIVQPHTLIKEGLDGLPGSLHSLFSKNEPLRISLVCTGALNRESDLRKSAQRKLPMPLLSVRAIASTSTDKISIPSQNRCSRKSSPGNGRLLDAELRFGLRQIASTTTSRSYSHRLLKVSEGTARSAANPG